MGKQRGRGTARAVARVPSCPQAAPAALHGRGGSVSCRCPYPSSLLNGQGGVPQFAGRRAAQPARAPAAARCLYQQGGCRKAAASREPPGLGAAASCSSVGPVLSSNSTAGTKLKLSFACV